MEAVASSQKCDADKQIPESESINASRALSESVSEESEGNEGRGIRLVEVKA
jgi:hypothetical protein